MWGTVCAALFWALLALAPANSALAQTVSANSEASIVIVRPLTLVKSQDLDFGRIAPSATGGTVTLNPDALTCAVTGGLVHAGTCQPAEFVGMGARRMMVRFQMPTTITLTGPGQNMTVTNFTLDTTPDLTFVGGNGNGLGNGNRRYRIEPSSGIFTFRVGGRLNVNANQAGGNYTGTFQVTVQYN